MKRALVTDLTSDVKVINETTNTMKIAEEKMWKMDKALWALINHYDANVRAAVAEVGYGLEKLITDESPLVRIQVVKWNYGLEILVNDLDEDVRAAVAEQGYGLEKLATDESPLVRNAVVNYILRDIDEDKKNVLKLILFQG